MAGKHRNRRQARGIRIVLATIVVVAAVAVVSLSLWSGGAGSAHGPQHSQGTTTSTTPQTSTTTSTTTTSTTTPLPRRAGGPQTLEHYSANGNFSGSTYLPGAVGFNLADVPSNAVAAALPAGVKALVWIGTCDGATASFQSIIASSIGDAKVFGFYLMDDPNPSSCSATNLKAESDWVHARRSGDLHLHHRAEPLQLQPPLLPGRLQPGQQRHRPVRPRSVPVPHGQSFDVAVHLLLDPSGGHRSGE